jgi:hypothetical protein
MTPPAPLRRGGRRRGPRCPSYEVGEVICITSGVLVRRDSGAGSGNEGGVLQVRRLGSKLDPQSKPLLRANGVVANSPAVH